jgi:hypothetical protein
VLRRRWLGLLSVLLLAFSLVNASPAHIFSAPIANAQTLTAAVEPESCGLSEPLPFQAVPGPGQGGGNGGAEAAARAMSEIQLRELIKKSQPDILRRKELGNLFKSLGKDELIKIYVHHIKLKDVFDVIRDSNTQFRLSETNAVDALISPDGTATVKVAGKGVEGADILFLDSSGNVILGREIKCFTGQGSSTKAVLKAGLKQLQLDNKNGAKEILIQLPAGTTKEDAESRLAGMRGGKEVKELTAEDVTKLQSVQITIVDPSGKVLASESVLPIWWLAS